MINPEKKLVSLSQAAELVGVHKDTLRRAIKAGKLKGKKLPGGHYRVNLADLKEKYL